MSLPADPEAAKAMETLSAWAGDPAAGLPEELFLFLSRLVPMVNVELLIRNAREEILLTWRDDSRYGAGWHMPGGIIRYRETAAHRLHATAIRELGVDGEFDSEPLAVDQYIDPAHRERSHFVSLVYQCRLAGPPDPARRFTGGTPKAGEWSWHTRCPDDLIDAHAHYRRFFAER